MKSLLNVKSNLIKFTPSYNICQQTICRQAKKKKKKNSHSMPKALQYQKVLLIYEPNESFKDFIKFDRNALSTTEEAF